MRDYYKHLDPQRDFCEGETESVEMDPLRLLRDLSEALYLIRRAMHMDGNTDEGYRKARVRLEFILPELESVMNDYAGSLRPDRTKIMVKWIEELGDATYEFQQRHGEEE